MDKKKFWKGIESSYVIETDSKSKEALKAFVNNVPYVKQRLLQVKSMEVIPIDGYVNWIGRKYIVRNRRRRKQYYWFTCEPIPGQVAPKEKQLRMQRDMIQIHFHNEEGHKVFPADLFDESNEFEVEVSIDKPEEEKMPGEDPIKRIKYTLNSTKKDILDFLYVTLTQNSQLKEENERLLKRIGNLEEQLNDLQSSTKQNSRLVGHSVDNSDDEDVSDDNSEDIDVDDKPDITPFNINDFIAKKIWDRNGVNSPIGKLYNGRQLVLLLHKNGKHWFRLTKEEVKLYQEQLKSLPVIRHGKHEIRWHSLKHKEGEKSCFVCVDRKSKPNKVIIVTDRQ